MGIHLRRPSAEALDDLLEAASTAELTYDAVGASLDPDRPSPGLTRRRWSEVVGPATRFEAAAEVLRHWGVHRGAGLVVQTDSDLEVGTNVAMAARLPLGWIDLSCRVVAVVRQPDRAGFAYGTLPVHAEAGEESFVVERDGDDTRFTVVAVSRPSDPLARLVPPIAHLLQARATTRYLEALRRALAVA
jgi:uncharacterized protein (UPF0548 family)